METLIYADTEALSTAAAARITEIAREAVAARGRFTIALAGGSTPKQTYTLLAQTPFRDEINWARTIVFMSDERCVPASDDRSNFGMARGSLLSHVPVPAENIYPLPTEITDPDTIAAQYQTTLAQFFGINENNPPPAFDLVLLGLGDDGHTASLFPGKPSLSEQAKWVIASPPGTLPPPVERVTFTFPLINAARCVMFLVGGANKAEAVRDVLQGTPGVQTRPAVAVKPANGHLVWMLDTEAARLLT